VTEAESHSNTPVQLCWRLLPVWRPTAVSVTFLMVAHSGEARFAGESGMQTDTRHGFIHFIDYDGGVTEGYQSDQVIKALGQLRRKGHALEERTRAQLRGLVMKELGWSISQRQTIDRVLKRHLGK
jgi:hypothetical protein